jgi:hypothetical protein
MALAAGLGGSLFRQTTFPNALSKVSDDKQRAHLLARGYKKNAPFELSSLGIITGTWLVGRSMINGRFISRGTRAMIYAKDALVAGAVLTGIAGVYFDRVLEDEADHGEIAVSGMHATDASTPKAKKVFKAVQGISIAHMACMERASRMQLQRVRSRSIATYTRIPAAVYRQSM